MKWLEKNEKAKIAPKISLQDYFAALDEIEKSPKITPEYKLRIEELRIEARRIYQKESVYLSTIA